MYFTAGVLVQKRVNIVVLKLQFPKAPAYKVGLWLASGNMALKTFPNGKMWLTVPQLFVQT